MVLASAAYQVGQLFGLALWVLIIVGLVRTFSRKDRTLREKVLGTRRSRPSEPASNPYGGLRQQALSAVSNGLSAPGTGHPDVSGVVVDVPRGDAYSTIVALTDGTTSMYTSSGGGTIGTGADASVAAANHDLLSVVQTHLSAIVRDDAWGFPPPGSVRFHVLTPSGLRYEDVPEDCFWGRAPHALMPVIAATQHVLSAIGEATPTD